MATVLAVAAASLAVGAVAVRAHIVAGARTLQSLVADADLVAHARIVDAEPVAARSNADAGRDRPSVRAELVERLKGGGESREVRFVQHGHGVAHFEPGDEVLLFLVTIERSRELSGLATAQSHQWVSLQEHDEKFLLTPATRKVLLAAARGYASGEDEKIRDATLTLLTSRDADLAASALKGLVASPQRGGLRVEDLPQLEAVVRDEQSPMSVRSALLVELERRGLVKGSALWLRLLAPGVPESQLVVALRAAAGRAAEPPVSKRLRELAADPRESVASAAVAALGQRGASDAVSALRQALASPSSRVRSAAIRALAEVGTAESAAVLERAGREHPDPATRRLAAAQARRSR